MQLDKRLSPAVTAAAVVISACAPHGPAEYVAPSNRTIEMHTELTQDGETTWIYAVNRSSVAVVITSLVLRECENVQNTCGRIPFDVLVPPGRRVDLLRITPRNRGNESSFRYTYTWERAHDEEPQRPRGGSICQSVDTAAMGNA